MQDAICQWPQPLEPGDRVWAIAPSGPVLDREPIARSLQIWRDRGFDLHLAEGWDAQAGFLAGTDAQRRSQLQAALNDPRCRAIVCVRGGYGAARLLEHWDWPLFAGRGGGLLEATARSPVWLVGFSDVTALLWSLARQGVAGVHGPVLTTLGREPAWTVDRLFDLLAGRAIAPLQGQGWGGGIAAGRLFPGNLTVISSILNTPLQPSLEGAIVAIEDVAEYPYRLDRLLTQWRLSGLLSAIGGIAIGHFTACDPPPDRPSCSIAEMLRDRLGDLRIPIVSGLPFGHEPPNAALPVGTWVQLDGDAGTLEFL
ncbi:MAG: LD-carboxypeptidase [Oscillatoriales cyanobacterium]|nr:MAG: LD-carboxypeptidase [Oscillatoriales cyanobacterium]